MTRKRYLAACVLGALLGIATPASATEWPEEPFLAPQVSAEPARPATADTDYYDQLLGLSGTTATSPAVPDAAGNFTVYDWPGIV